MLSSTSMSKTNTVSSTSFLDHVPDLVLPVGKNTASIPKITTKGSRTSELQAPLDGKRSHCL